MSEGIEGDKMKEKIKIYHGSQLVIERPIYGTGNPKNDYGMGFYCTCEIELAKEWACTEENSGYVNQYEVDLSELSVINLSGMEYSILNWLAILLNNRSFRISNEIAIEGKQYLLEKFLPDTKEADAIIGYRADDSYFSFANAFLNNTISLTQLERAMYLGKLGEQTMIKSKTAFERMQFVCSEVADRNIYYPKRSARDREARMIYRRGIDTENAANSIYLIDILREGWESDDIRIRRNIP